MAQANLAYCYQFGEGVASDVLQAYAWYRLAADQALDGTDNEASALAASMSRSELEAAMRLYFEFKEKYMVKH